MLRPLATQRPAGPIIREMSTPILIAMIVLEGLVYPRLAEVTNTVIQKNTKYCAVGIIHQLHFESPKVGQLLDCKVTHESVSR